MNSAIANQLDVETIRKDFPILGQQIHRQKQLVYFDSGASFTASFGRY